MALNDIPEYVEVSPGDLIRAEDYNDLQRRTRNSVRSHRHTRIASDPVDDTIAEDNALQITTDEIADGAVTQAKLGTGLGLTGWFRSPFYPVQIATLPEFSISAANGFARSNATSAVGIMAIPVPPTATAVKRFRIVASQNVTSVFFNFGKLRTDGTFISLLSKTISGTPFDDTTVILSDRELDDSSSLCIVVNASNTSEIGLIAVEFE